MARESAENNRKQIVAAGKYVRLVNCGGWEFVERTTSTGIVVLVAVTDERKLILVEQYRPPVDSRVVELPAGLAGDLPGEELEELATAARRELLEETGYEAQEMTYLTQGPPSAGLSTEIVTLFLARGLTKTDAGGGDDSEDIEVHEVALDAALDWLEEKAAAGALIDPKVYTGLFFAGCHWVESPR
jgi:ADP-ribose pyrophosphatase